MNIKGKIALITGGAHRVGKAITRILAEEGAYVVINYNHAAFEAEQSALEMQALGVEALAVQCDVANYVAVQQMATTIQRHFGGVDIIVNSASLFGKTPFPSQEPSVIDTWQQVTRVSIDGAYYVCNALAPVMLQRGGGVIVNIVDLAAWRPWRNFAAHGVGKAGLIALTRQMALELAPTIRVNAIAPGPVLPPTYLQPEQAERLAQRTLLKRWGKPEDVAHAVKYLVEADYVTGEVLTVDGGEMVN